MTISYDEFSKVELRIATVLSAERVEGSEKLLKIQIDLGSDPSTGSGLGQRQIISGIAKSYDPAVLVGKQIVVTTNLEPRIIMGLESNALLLASGNADGPVILIPDRPVPPGSGVK